MTRTLPEDLSALAATVVVPPLDAAGIVRRAHAERTRARAVGAMVAAVAVALGSAGTLALLSQDEGLSMTTPGNSAGPAAPTEEAPPRAVAPGINAPAPTRIAETDDFGRITDSFTEDVGGTYLRIERVDMLTGQAARDAAAADGQELSTDYYLRPRPEVWTRYRVSADAAVWGSITLSRSVDPVRSDLASLIRLVDGGPGAEQALFHLDVEDGAVIGLEEQYRP